MDRLQRALSRREMLSNCGTGLGLLGLAGLMGGLVFFSAGLSLGARIYSTDDAISFTKIFVATEFSGGERHARRLTEIAEYEKSGALPPLPS